MSLMRLAPVALAAAMAPLPAQSPLQSQFSGGFVITNTNPPPSTELFDIQVVAPGGITVTSIDVLCNINAGTNGTFGVWVTAPGGTHVNNQLNAAAWTQVASATVVHNGGTVPVALPTPFYLAPGTYGMAFHYVGMNAVYSNPTNPVVLPTTYSNLDGTLDMSASRVRSSSALDPFDAVGGNGFSPRQPNIAIHYTNGATSVDFSGTPVRGQSPLDVQFTSIAFSGNPGGVQGFLWDFGDGAQSTVTNPLHTYTTCGNYTVSLTMVDSLGAYTATKTNYVQTDLLTPAFNNLLIAPNQVQFIDQTAGGPLTWAWDFNGDGVVDSTQQNPVVAFPNACDEVTVSLTVTRSCQPAATLTKKIAVASSLETTFQAGLVISATAAGGTNFLDVDVANPKGVTVCGMHLDSNVANGSPVTVNIWQKPGTYVGAVEDATKWRQVASAVVTSLGYGARTFVPLSPPIHLAAGVHGLGIELVGGSPGYTNLGAVTSFGNPDLTITAGLVQLSPIFGPAATSTQFSPRIWNGALHYSTTSSNGAAGYGLIGLGCAGSLGVPGNVATAQPVINSTASWTIDKLPFGIGVLVLGLTPIPALDLGFLGMPGCPLHVSPDVTLTLVGAGNSVAFDLPIPNNNALLGFQLYTQALSLDLGLNAFGFAISDAAVALIGQ